MNVRDIVNALKNDEVECKGGDAFFFTALCGRHLAQACLPNFPALSKEDENEN